MQTLVEDPYVRNRNALQLDERLIKELARVRSLSHFQEHLLHFIVTHIQGNYHKVPLVLPDYLNGDRYFEIAKDMDGFLYLAYKKIRIYCLEDLKATLAKESYGFASLTATTIERGSVAAFFDLLYLKK